MRLARLNPSILDRLLNTAPESRLHTGVRVNYVSLTYTKLNQKIWINFGVITEWSLLNQRLQVNNIPSRIGMYRIHFFYRIPDIPG